MARSNRWNRHSMTGTSSMYTISDVDHPVCGFLNRKSVTDSSGKKSKDRQWQTLWCQLKDNKMEFYKVPGISVNPPPRDIYPPPNRQKHHSGFIDLEGSLLEIDYTSQKDKDIDKRRKNLFRLTLYGKNEFLFQAPSENQLMLWITNIKRQVFHVDNDTEDGSDLSKGDVRIKASRCSINKKSKHNTNSVRVLGRVDADDDDFDGDKITLADIDPRLLLLKKRLQAKRSLMKHIDKMIRSYDGDTACIYREVDVPPHEDTDSSTIKSNSDIQPERVVTELLDDYYLIPGVEWSLVKKGETVLVVNRLPNGWYKCRIPRDTHFELDPIPSNEEMYNNNNNTEGEEQNGHNEQENHEPNTDPSHTNDTPNNTEDHAYTNEDYGPNNEVPAPRLRTDSYMMATTDYSLLKSRPHSFLRKESYKVATQGSGGSNSKTRHLSLVGTPLQHNDCDDIMMGYEMIRLRARVLINTERHNNSYIFPLVGSIPPSLLKAYQHLAIKSKKAPPTSATPTNDEDFSDFNLSSSFSEALDTPTSSVTTPSIDIGSIETTPSIDIPESLETTPSINISESLETTPSIDISSLSTSIDVPIEEDPIPLSPTTSPLPLSSPIISPSPPPTSPSPPTSLSLSTYRTSRVASAPVSTLSTVEELSYSEDNKVEGTSSMAGDDDAFIKESIPTTPKRRSSNKEMKVLPSPTHTTKGSMASGSGQKVSFKEPKPTQGRSKRIQSEDMGQKKGLFKRLRTNLLGHMKKDVSPKPEPHPPAVKGVVDDELGEMRSRVTSVSGKAIRSRGMEVTFGDSSSESETDENEDTTTLDRQKKYRSHAYTEITINEKGSSNSTGKHEPLSKVMSTPVTSSVSRQVGPMENSSLVRRRIDSRSFSSRNLYDGTKILGFIQAPPKRVKRYIYLDPSQMKYGLHLENYELHMDQGKVPRAIVQYVTPGSPAFVAGLYPGDQILSVNKKDVSRLRVSEVVNAIQNADVEESLELVVAYVDGVHRLEVQAKGMECRDQLRDRQKQLQNLITSHGKISDVVTPPFSPPVSPMTPSYIDVTSWARESLSDEEPSLHMFRYNKKFNEMLCLSYDDVRHIPCDMLIVPLVTKGGKLQTILKAGGEGLLDELSTADHCCLGENIVTGGYTLPAQAICHTVFGSSEESVISCCRSALETAYEQNYKSILFWIEGFVLAGVSPDVIVSTIRGWLEEGNNGSAFEQINFNILSTPAIISLIERYFPLEDYDKYRAFISMTYCTDSEDEEEEEEEEEKEKEVFSPPPLLPPRLTNNLTSNTQHSDTNIHQPSLLNEESSTTTTAVHHKEGPFITEGEHSTVDQPLPIEEITSIVKEDKLSRDTPSKEPFTVEQSTEEHLSEEPSSMIENVIPSENSYKEQFSPPVLIEGPTTSEPTNHVKEYKEVEERSSEPATATEFHLISHPALAKPKLQAKDSFLDSLSELDSLMNAVDDSVASLTQ